MLFKKDLSLTECKDYLLTQLRSMSPTVSDETSKSIKLKIDIKKRTITIALSIIGGKAIVDTTDNYFLLHIPRETLTSMEKYKQYIIYLTGKLYDELGITE